jgi:hypothetical protein
MKRKWKQFDLWFNINIAPYMTNPRKMHLLIKRIENQQKELKELDNIRINCK